MMAGLDKIRITVKGKGGHSSMINELIDPVYATCLLNIKINDMMPQKYGPNFDKTIRISFPFIESASACNVIPDVSKLEGSLRTFDNDLRKDIIENIRQVAKEVEQSTKCQIAIEVLSVCRSSVNNDPKLTENFVQMLGNKVRTDRLPVYASEDFASYQLKIPGVFFFLAGGSQCGETVHVDHYNFNDEIIEKGAQIFFDIVRNRFS